MISHVDCGPLSRKKNNGLMIFCGLFCILNGFFLFSGISPTKAQENGPAQDYSAFFKSSFSVDSGALEKKPTIIIISGDGVNIRSGPSQSHSIIGKGILGEEYLAILGDDGWYVLDMPDIVGWISEKFVQLLNEKSDGTIEGMITGNGVNIRKGPGTDNPYAARGSKGGRLVILDKEQGWYKIRMPLNQKGYIFSELALNKEKALRIVGGSGVNIRENPGQHYRLVGSLPQGSRVYFDSQEGEWSKIITENKRFGWVLSAYLEDSPAGALDSAQLSSLLALKELDIQGFIGEVESLLNKGVHGLEGASIRYYLAEALVNGGDYGPAIKQLNIIIADAAAISIREKAQNLLNQIKKGPMDGVTILSSGAMASGFLPLSSDSFLIASFASRWGFIEKYTAFGNTMIPQYRSTDIVDQNFVTLLNLSNIGPVLCLSSGFYQIKEENNQLIISPLPCVNLGHMNILSASNHDLDDDDKDEIIALIDGTLGISQSLLVLKHRQSGLYIHARLDLDYSAGQLSVGPWYRDKAILIERKSLGGISSRLIAYTMSEGIIREQNTVTLQVGFGDLNKLLMEDLDTDGHSEIITLSPSGFTRELRQFSERDSTGIFTGGFPLNAVDISAYKAGTGQIGISAISPKGDIYFFKRF